MKAAVLTAFRKPLEFKDIPTPEPGPAQVRLRMHASGLCGTDMHVIHGILPVPLPIVFGHEPVGVIDKTGPGVSGLKVGDRVGVCWNQSGCGRCDECQKQRVKYCKEARSWVHNGGGNSEFMIAEAAGCTLLPEQLAWEHAAPLFCAGFTVMSGYRNARPRPGERVAVVGIGGLGHLAVQVAKAMGHETIAITGSASKRDEAKALGADDVLVIKEHAGKELMAMGGADVVLSTSNNMQHNTQLIDGLRNEGRLVTMALSNDKIELDPTHMLVHQVSVVGSMQNNREDLFDVLQLAAQGKVKPKLELYSFNELNKAIERLEAGKVRLRAVMLHDR